jgi:glycosyltransferase involved in cell wall biosynthesis
LLRVLFANVTADVGGSEQVLVSLAERLPSYGMEASFALFRPGPLAGLLQSRGISVHVFPYKYRFRDVRSVWRCIQWLAACIRTDEADLLHSNLTAHLIGAWSARMTKVPELWHLHDYPFKFDPAHAINRLIGANFYLFTTDYIKSGEPFLARRRHAVINPDCIDVSKLRCALEASSIHERLAVKPHAYFLTVARLQEHKGHKYLLEAAAQVAHAHPDIKWVIAGGASGPEQEDYLTELKNKVALLNLHDRVLLPGFIANDDLGPLFRDAVALVHPAVTEGYGLVLLEAMAHGLPVIAAASAGPAEIIQHEKNGLLVPVRDKDALVSAMNRLLEDPALAGRLRAQADVDVAQRSVDVMVRETVAVYRRILATK